MDLASSKRDLPGFDKEDENEIFGHAARPLSLTLTSFPGCLFFRCRPGKVKKKNPGSEFGSFLQILVLLERNSHLASSLIYEKILIVVYKRFIASACCGIAERRSFVRLVVSLHPETNGES